MSVLTITEKIILAKTTNDIKTLNALSYENDLSIKTAVAGNPVTNYTILKRLAKSGNNLILPTIASNSNIEEELLLSFLNSSNRSLVLKALSNPVLSLETLNNIQLTPWIADGMSGNVNCSTELLKTISLFITSPDYSTSYGIKWTIQKIINHDNCNESIVKMFYGYRGVYETILNSGHASKEFVIKMASMNNEQVRFAAYTNLLLSEGMIKNLNENISKEQIIALRVR